MCTIPLEILGQYLGVVPNFSKVHSLATFGEEQQSIEALEQHCRRLMNLYN
jgi:hypothetical protein